MQLGPLVFVDLCCGFGWTASPCAFSTFSSTLSTLHRRRHPTSWQYCDDGFGVEPSPAAATAAAANLRRLITLLAGPDAVAHAKSVQGRQVTILGILVDLNAGLLAIPAARRASLALSISSLAASPFPSYTDVASVVGRLRHVASCCTPLLAALNPLQDHLTALASASSPLPAPPEWRELCDWWGAALSAPLATPLRSFGPPASTSQPRLH